MFHGTFYVLVFFNVDQTFFTSTKHFLVSIQTFFHHDQKTKRKQVANGTASSDDTTAAPSQKLDSPRKEISSETKASSGTESAPRDLERLKSSPTLPKPRSVGKITPGRENNEALAAKSPVGLNSRIAAMPPKSASRNRDDSPPGLNDRSPIGLNDLPRRSGSRSYVRGRSYESGDDRQDDQGEDRFMMDTYEGDEQVDGNHNDSGGDVDMNKVAQAAKAGAEILKAVKAAKVIADSGVDVGTLKKNLENISGT